LSALSLLFISTSTQLLWIIVSFAGVGDIIFPKATMALLFSGSFQLTYYSPGTDSNVSNALPPMVFETMIEGGEHDMYQERYPS